MPENNLNLPKTAFSMKANLPSKEPKILETWDKTKLYDKLRKKSAGKEKFILHDGPPYANGHIHMGTALNKILKDIVTKFHQMRDKDSIYVPGWDCHGLPIEWKIEEQYKKKKKNKDEIPTKDFRKECREFAEKWIEIHKKEFKRLGVIGDWENYYSTMSFEAEAQIVRELGKFLTEGSLYKGFKPVLWSTVEKTALADAEVEYKDHKSNTIYAEFQVKKTNKDYLKDVSVIIWTTTPWTIPANKALAYNKDISYSVLELKNKKIVVAEKLINSVIADCGLEKFKIIKSFKGEEFKNTICSHPFKNLGYNFDIPMLEANFVTLEQGTGIVHCAPSHGPDDFNLCLKHGMKAIETVNNELFKKNKNIFSSDLLYKIQNKNFSNSDFNELVKNDKFIKLAYLENVNDDRLFTNNSMKLIYSLPKNSFLLVTDETKNIYLARIDETYEKDILKDKKDFSFYSDKANNIIKDNLYTSYNYLMNNKYKINVNQKTIDRVKNYFQ